MSTKQNFQKPIPITRGSKINRYYDTQPVVQNSDVITFFPKSADPSNQKANYTSVPLPGNNYNLVVGLEFNFTEPVIRSRFINYNFELLNQCVKEGIVLFKADQNNKQFLHDSLDKYTNREIDFASGTRFDGAGAPIGNWQAQYTRPSGFNRLQEPFVLAPQQTFKLELHWNDSSLLPDVSGTPYENSFDMHCIMTTVEMTESQWEQAKSTLAQAV